MNLIIASILLCANGVNLLGEDKRFEKELKKCHWQ